MYNQYLDDSEFILLEPEPQANPPGHQSQGQNRSHPHGQNRPNQPHPGQNRPNQPHPGQNRPAPKPGGPLPSKNDLAGEVTRALSQLLDGVLKHFSLENFDTGDILLVLIILFLYLEGDNLELVITLGLMLLLGLGGDEAAAEEK